MPVALVGNKIDLPEDRHRVHAKHMDFARKKNIPFFPISTKERVNCVEPISWILDRIGCDPVFGLFSSSIRDRHCDRATSDNHVLPRDLPLSRSFLSPQYHANLNYFFHSIPLKSYLQFKVTDLHNCFMLPVDQSKTPTIRVSNGVVSVPRNHFSSKNFLPLLCSICFREFQTNTQFKGPTILNCHIEVQSEDTYNTAAFEMNQFDLRLQTHVCPICNSNKFVLLVDSGDR